ncbi:MAG: hypothetical protein JNL64_02405 [Blastocatellia bacterium]|nr:hypothetical protein [Blastocatellia bacterium]
MIKKLRLAAMIVLATTIFSTVSIFSQTPERVLTPAETESVLEEAARGALEAIGDEAVFDAVVERWEAREDFEGKTRSQILRLLFADVQAVIQDPAIRTAIWRAWHPPAPVATQPRPAATPVPAQNSQGLSELEAFRFATDLRMSAEVEQAAGRVPALYIKWSDLNSFAGKTRAEIMRQLFADVQAKITDPAARKIIWDRWNRPAAPTFEETKAPQPIPQTPTGYLAVVSKGNNDRLVNESVPLLRWDVTVIDEQKRPVAGARVALKLVAGTTGLGIINSVGGRPISDGVVQSATTDNAGRASFAVAWTNSVRYELTVTSAQGRLFQLGEISPYDGPASQYFFWNTKWEPSKTISVFTPEGAAASNGREAAEAATIEQLLLRPADDWSRTGWTPDWTEQAVSINSTFAAPVSDALRAKLTNYQKNVGALNILKLALTPASFERLKQLNTFVQSQPRSNQNAVVSVDIGGKSVDVTATFKQPPNANLYQRCKAETEGQTTTTMECARVLASVVPYQKRWNAINLSCLDNPGLVPVANEFAALVRTQRTFDAGLIKYDYPLLPGTEISTNDYGPPDTRGWICNALVKNEMAKDMARDGFAPAVLNEVLAEQFEEVRPTITTANIGGRVEKVTDQAALLDLFRKKDLISLGIAGIGSDSPWQGETPPQYRARVEAFIKTTVDPVSRRPNDNALVVFRVKSLHGKDPAKELTTIGTFLEIESVRLYDSYDRANNLTPERPDDTITFRGKVPPGRPVPDKRDVAVAVYGWIIGLGENDGSSPHLALVPRRWVMYNIHTGDIYGTTEASGDPQYEGKLFRKDQ